MTNKNLKVIFDTNVWISFLIGKGLSRIKKHLVDGQITIVTTDQLILEIRLVTARENLKKYFLKESVTELIDLLETIALKIPIQPIHFLSRDPKENFLLDLIDFSDADFLVTGDKDLLEFNPFKTAKIITPNEFENLFKG